MTEEHPTALPFLPRRKTMATLRRAAATCAGCDLHHLGTQTVFGEGPVPARVMLLGEQPGDREDVEGHPFVGPAGRMLDQALEEVGLDREQVYLSNAVKHFRFEMRGKRRIHRKPSMAQISACRPWLEAELIVVKPQVLALMGAVAAQAIMGQSFKVTEHRGEIVDAPDLAPRVVPTVHPASILRAPDPRARDVQRAAFVRDLAVVARAAAAA